MIMIKFKHFFLLGFLALGQFAVAQVKVGNNPTTVHPSSVMEMESTTKGMLPPRMTQAQINAIAAPAEGLMVYCTDCFNKGYYFFDGVKWQRSGVSAESSAVTVNAAAQGFEGSYTASVPMVSAKNKFSVTITNNSFSVVPLAFATGDLVLSGAGKGSCIVASVTPASGNINPGAALLVTYTLSGTPTAGNMNASWTKLSMNGTNTVEVKTFEDNFTATCQGMNTGNYIKNIAFTSNNTLTVNFKNDAAESATIAFATNDISLTGPGAAGLSVTGVSTSSQVLATGASVNVTYTFSGTPTASGDLIATFTKNDEICVSTREVQDFNQHFSAVCADINPATANYIRTIAFTSANTVQVTLTNTTAPINVPFTFTAADLSLSGDGAAGLTVASVSPTTHAGLAMGASVVLTFTLSGTPTTLGDLNANFDKFGLTCSKTVEIDEFSDRFTATCADFLATGNYLRDVAFTANNKITVTLKNDSAAITVPFTFATSNLTLSGAGSAGLTVTGVTPASGNIAQGAEVAVTFTLSGTPTTLGDLIATFNMRGETCATTKAIEDFSGSFTIACNDITAGNYIRDVAFNTDNKMTVTVTNDTAPTAVPFTFAASDLVLSGAGAAGLSVTSVSPTTGTLAIGQTATLTFQLSGTPTSLGTMTATFTKKFDSCASTKEIILGDATFSALPMNKEVISFTNAGVADVQGVINNATNQIVYTIPYTGGLGPYDGYTSAAIPLVGESGDGNNITISYPAGTFSAAGNLTVTVNVSGDGSFNVTKQPSATTTEIVSIPLMVNGTSRGELKITAVGPVKDAKYGDGPHNFLYLPVLEVATGRTWLNNNLGANYAKVGHADFNPFIQSTAFNDHKAYGSLFQWGRVADGHEIINWTAATTTDGVEQSNEGAGPVASTLPSALFYTSATDWYSPAATVNRWATGENNPCPTGYRLPTSAEWSSFIAANNVSSVGNTYLNSELKLSYMPYRNNTNGAITSGFGLYWSSTVNGNNSHALQLESGQSTVISNNQPRARAFAVRCIQN